MPIFASNQYDMYVSVQFAILDQNRLAYQLESDTSGNISFSKYREVNNNINFFFKYEKNVTLSINSYIRSPIYMRKR